MAPTSRNSEKNASSSGPQKAVELLLPVGTREMALAAIHNGADAIYMGVPGFNARGRSHDFAMTELKEIIDLCHLYGVRVNLAFNIVIFQEELHAAVQILEKILPLKPDAFIVQDLGLVRLIREMVPEQKIHASTQMTVTNFEAIELLQDLGIRRFVLGRENSIQDIEQIRAKTDVELEVFVHGALCVSYSGQCFTSASLGGRSANRGQCAQSCRFSYELIVDGKTVDMGERRYLVSPQDLCGLGEVPGLLTQGVNCFKVEGRLKTPEYVATTARSYRKAIEAVTLGKSFSPSESQAATKEMAVSYSRGFFKGWLQGVEHQKLVDGTFSSHRGFAIGRIVSRLKGASGNQLVIELNSGLGAESLQAGDGLLWTGARGEQGGFIYGIQSQGKNLVTVEFSRELELFEDVVGSPVYQNHDKELKKTVAQSVEDKNKKRRIGIDVRLFVENGKPLKAIVKDEYHQLEKSTVGFFEPAKNKGISDGQLREEFSALTGSIFKLNFFDVQRAQDEPLFLSHREIKELRQGLIADLESRRQNSQALAGLIPKPLPDVMNWLQRSAEHNSGIPKLHILLRGKNQVDDLTSAIQTGQLNAQLVHSIDCVTLDFEFGRDYQSSVDQIKAAGLRVGLATTRILKPNEYRNLKALLNLKPDVLLVRNLGALQFFSQTRKGFSGIFPELKGDFSLNVTNHLAAEYLLEKGLASLCVSYDLNSQQVSALLSSSQASKMEVTAYQYMPSFHMEHCVFAAFLSKGSSYKDCGKPCEKHDVLLKDQFGNTHQIKPDHECRNTMYNSKAQSAARYVQDWAALGLGLIRFEALKEQGPELMSKIKKHLEFLQGAISAPDLMKDLGTIESYGLSEGSLSRTQEYQSRKK